MTTDSFDAALERESPIVVYLRSPENAGGVAFLWPMQVVEPFGKLWDVMSRSEPGAAEEAYVLGTQVDDAALLVDDGVNPDWTDDSRVVDVIGARFFRAPPTSHSASVAEAIAWLEARGADAWIAALSS